MACDARSLAAVVVEETVQELDTDTGDHDRFTHIILRDRNKGASVKVTEAMVEGVPVRALCGKLWVPSRDPLRFPLCPDCERIRDDLLREVG